MALKLGRMVSLIITQLRFMQHSQLGNVKGQKSFETIKQQLLGRFI